MKGRRRGGTGRDLCRVRAACTRRRFRGKPLDIRIKSAKHRGCSGTTKKAGGSVYEAAVDLRAEGVVTGGTPPRLEAGATRNFHPSAPPGVAENLRLGREEAGTEARPTITGPAQVRRLYH